MEVTVIKLTHDRDQAHGERAAYGMSLFMLFESLSLFFIPRTDTESVFDSFL